MNNINLNIDDSSTDFSSFNASSFNGADIVPVYELDDINTNTSKANIDYNQEVETMDFNDIEAIDKLHDDLKLCGFVEGDINRVLNGDISIDELIEEIYADSNTARKKLLMQSSYLESFGLEFNSMKELKGAIESIDKELKELIYNRDNSLEKELNATIQVINMLQNGQSLESVLNTNCGVWEYVDENGNKCYSYDDPYRFGNKDGITYKALTYGEMYGNSESFVNLESVLSKNEVNPFFGKSYSMSVWDGNTEQLGFLNSINSELKVAGEEVEKINSQIAELQQEKGKYQYIEGYINDEVDHYLNNIDEYVRQEDFSDNSYFDNSSLECLNELKREHQNDINNNGNYDYSGVDTLYVNDKKDIVNVISCLLNDKGDIVDGCYQSDTAKVYLNSKDSMLNHYMEWESLVSDNERDCFNYILNTKGSDAAYSYLEDISGSLDTRWLANETQIDQEFASLHPVLSSLASVVVTPFEGMNAFASSLKAKFNGEEIKRTDVYSSGNTYRGQVSQDIMEEHGKTAAFIYNTGMSMADTGTLIAANAITGGAATPFLSAALMGSRSYVATLNDALDRGLDDDKAIILASASSLVETAMESYSVGHLFNLEKTLGNGVSNIVDRIANSIPNPKLAKIATNTAYICAGALSQGLAEGEEELSTEALNFIVDEVISGDLSSHTLAINNYMNMGYNEDDARRLANKDFKGQLKQAFLGGLLSGGVFGAASSTYSSHNINKTMVNDIMNEFNVNEAQAFAKAVKFGQMQVNGDVGQNDIRQKVDNKLNREQILQKLDLSPAVLNFIDKNDINVEELYYDKEAFLSNHSYDEDSFLDDFILFSLEEKMVSIADIIGMGDETNGKNILETLSFRFDERKNNNYHSRVDILDNSVEDIILSATDPSKGDKMRVGSVGDGKYIVSVDGKHRYTLLRTLYLSERLGADDLELDMLYEKYMIPVLITKVKEVKSCFNYLFNFIKKDGEFFLYDEAEDVVTVNFKKYDDAALIEFIKDRAKELGYIKMKEIYDDSPLIVQKFMESNNLLKLSSSSVVKTNVNIENGNVIVDSNKTFSLEEEILKYPNVSLEEIERFKCNGLNDKQIIDILPLLHKGKKIFEEFNILSLSGLFNNSFVNSSIGGSLFGNLLRVKNYDLLVGVNSYLSKILFDDYTKDSNMSLYHCLYSSKFGMFLANCNCGEIRSLMSYTGENYKNINSNLRNKKLENFDVLQQKMLDSAIDKFMDICGDEVDDMILYRCLNLENLNKNSSFGMLFSHIDLNDNEQVFSVLKALEGSSILEEGYMSTSVSREIANSYLENNGIEFQIATPKGTKGIYLEGITATKGDSEFLFAKNTSLLVQDVSLETDINGQSKIIVKCVANSDNSFDVNDNELVKNEEQLGNIKMTNLYGNEINVEGVKGNYKQLKTDIDLIEQKKSEWFSIRKRIYESNLDDLADDGITSFEEFIKQIPDFNKEEILKLQELEEYLIGLCK